MDNFIGMQEELDKLLEEVDNEIIGTIQTMEFKDNNAEDYE